MMTCNKREDIMTHEHHQHHARRGHTNAPSNQKMAEPETGAEDLRNDGSTFGVMAME